MKLSPTEQSILSALEQANGEVVSRQSFGIESDKNMNSSNVVEVMICRLRKKLDADAYDVHGVPTRPVRIIQTIRSVGYRLVTP